MNFRRGSNLVFSEDRSGIIYYAISAVTYKARGVQKRDRIGSFKPTNFLIQISYVIVKLIFLTRGHTVVLPMAYFD